ncbi:serine/threonine-protein kinase LMTK1-like [Pollicipes pollicipes]|uniref:serine/threonine-protein kinase LMTK1-like n=1 Tax=Pollicipes pollicipes TaxID=41117 RepID=UPI0018852A22|nr:serine/threonine-protein kinase LMTK1-like [Pollicipes pollicipes]
MGDAKEFLQSRSSEQRQLLLDTMSLNKMAMDAASGLQHLHDIHYTHSDLAARNCRIMENCTLKIGDYGCSIDKYKEDYYIAGEVALPVRWCAPEILECTPSTIETKGDSPALTVPALKHAPHYDSLRADSPR